MKGIYKITSPTNRIYIGQTINIDERRKDYETNNCKAQRLLYNSLKKYGFDNHIFEVIIIGEFSIEELNDLEIKYIKEFNSFRGWNKRGMNLTTGGSVCKRYEGSKQKISDSLKNFHSEVGHSEETRNKISSTLCGRKQLQTTIDKRKESNKKYWDRVGRIGRKKIEKRREENYLIKQHREIRNQQIVEDIKAGIRQNIIAEKYNLSPSVITQLKKKNDVQIETGIGRGQNNNFSKLTEQQVREIKKMLRSEMKQKEIAELYNVKVRTIKAIKSGQNWSHITI